MKKMKNGRAAGSDDLRIQMLAVAEQDIIWWTKQKRLLKTCMREGKITEGCRTECLSQYGKERETHMTLEYI